MEVSAELKTCKTDYDRLYDGYAELVKAHAEALVELSILKDEPIRYPLTVSDDVAVDVCGAVMELI